MGAIRGVVTNAANGQPVDQTWIQITPNPYHAEDHARNKDIYTDARGAYVIELPPGNYRLSVRSADPTHPPTDHLLTLRIGESLTADFSITVAPPMPSPMPYGAPPARRRLVWTHDRCTLGIVAFTLPDNLIFNTQKLAAPAEFAREHDAASWLYLNGEEFNSMDGGMSYAQVQEAVAHSANVITDPPRVLDLELARQHCAALDELPRPTLITCRAGPRASAVSYMYAGLRAGATPEEVLAAAETAGAPFCKFEDYKEWVTTSITTLRSEGR